MAFNPGRQLIPKSVSVAELFKSTYFIVPPNQREYRWSNEQFEKLWDDLIITVNDDFSENNSNSLGHFLGAVVVIGHETSHDQERWEIIDGQQRLTTITILSSCLLEYCAEIKDPKIRMRLEHVLLDCICAPHSDFSPRLRLNREDEFYKNSILEHNSRKQKEEYWAHNSNKQSEVQKNIKEAFTFFYKSIDAHLQNQSDEIKSDRIRDLIDALTDHFYLLVVRAESLWMAYRLFETLNERGLDLSQADLIKNVLLQHAKIDGTAALDGVEKHWTSFIDNYEEQPSKKLDLPQLIQFSYTYRHQKVKKEKIFDEVSRSLRKGKVQSFELTRELYRDSSNWLIFTQGEAWPELRQLQTAILEPLWKSHCAPFIIAAIDQYSNDIEKLKRCLELTENYLFRQGLVSRDSVSSLQDFFSECAFLLRTGQDLGLVEKFFKKKSPDEIFKENFSIATISNARQGHYILSKIENFINKNQSTSNYSLHYILPRRPDDAWGELKNAEELTAYTSRIGNLLLIQAPKNQQIKSLSFHEKLTSVPGYNECNSALTQELLSLVEDWAPENMWNFSSINKRQRHLAEKYSQEVWPL